MTERGDTTRRHEDFGTLSSNGNSSHQLEWRVGTIILDDYIIDKILGRGGMGDVFLVANRHEKSQKYALKTLRYRSGQDLDSKLMFLQELRRWISLPNHPNLTACRFFRSIGDRIGIFADYVDGGSLQDWIDACMESSEPVTLARILDIAIQAAWGITIAHKAGLVHQDIKPANVLLTRSGIAKITDFGTSRARDIQTDTSDTSDSSLLVSSAGFTPLYCSPEQAEGHRINTKTDIWSFGLLIYQMFVGRLKWRIGSVAGLALSAYQYEPDRHPFPPMPESIRRILDKCFQINPADRWASMSMLANELIQIHGIECGPYHREFESPTYRFTHLESPFRRMTLRGETWDDPCVWLQRAYSLAGDPEHSIDRFVRQQQTISQNQRFIDLEIFEEAVRIFSRLVRDGTREIMEEFADLLWEKSCLHESLHDESGALIHLNYALEFLQKSDTEDTPNVTILLESAQILGSIGNILWKTHHYLNALHYIHHGLKNISRVKKHLGGLTRDGVLQQAKLQKVKGNVHWAMDQKTQALAQYRRSIALFQSAITPENKDRLRENIAGVQSNMAAVLWEMGQAEESLQLFDESLRCLDELQHKMASHQLLMALAAAYLNSANVLSAGIDLDKSLQYYDKAIAIWQSIAQSEGYNIVLADIAKASLNKASVLQGMERYTESLELVNTAYQLYSCLTHEEGIIEARSELAWAQLCRAAIYDNTGEPELARSCAREGMEILEKENIRAPHPFIEQLITWASNDLKHLLL